MRRFPRRAATIGVFALLGVALAVLSPNSAQAGWYNCPEDPGHVAFNPVTGNSMRAGHDENFLGSSDQATWMWVCVDDGGTTGAHSIGTATYYNQGGRPGVVQHSPICLDVVGSGCIETYVGARVAAQDAGAVGAKPCVHPVVAENNPCVSVGATPSPSAPITHTVKNPGAGAICGVMVAGTCTVPEATATVSGTVGTVYVGTAPTPVTVPDVTVCANRSTPSGYSPLSVNPGTTC